MGSSSGAFDRLRQEVDRWMEVARVAGERTLDAVGLSAEGRPYPPACDVIETQTDVHVLVDLPGVAADGVELSMTGPVLSLKAIRLPSPLLTDSQTVHVRERLPLTFERSIPLSVPVDADSVRAVVRDGQLHVTLKKSHVAQARPIPVHRGNDIVTPPPAL